MSLHEINGSNFYCETVGTGTPLLMMHGGLGLDHTYFRPWFDQMADVAQVIYYDHRGNGRSDKPEDFSTLTLDQLVDDAAHLLDHLGIDKVILFGHSYGGFLAQLFAIKYPERLKGLVLANTVPVFDYQPQPNGNDEQMAAFGAAFTRPMESNEDWRQTWTTLWQIYFKNYDSEVGDRVDAATHYSYAAWNAASGALATFNTVEGLPNVNVPTLVVSGKHDFICPPEHGGERIDSLLPRSELAIFEESAHYPFVEEEERFFNVLRGWLAQTSG